MDHPAQPTLVKLASLRDVRADRGLVVECNGHEIALFREGENVLAVSNVCPHQHAPVLAEGCRTGSEITCPLHGWSFDLHTGCSPTGSGSIRVFPVIVRNGEVLIEPPEPPVEWEW